MPESETITFSTFFGCSAIVLCIFAAMGARCTESDNLRSAAQFKACVEAGGTWVAGREANCLAKH